MRPYSPYGQHKLQMENMLRAYATSFGVASVIVRLFSVYGAGLRKQLLWDLCSRLVSGERRIELHGTGDELRDWIDVRDTIRAIVETSALAGQDVPVINVGSGIATSVRVVAETTLAAWGVDPRSELAFSGRARPGDPLSLQADTKKLESLGFHWRVPVSMGIADYVGWFRGQSDAAS
jgi:UDP-glucose 4-epimerase